MRNFFQKLLVVLVAAAACRSAQAFSLLGELEAWQTQGLGYNLPNDTDIGGPKNIREEYRWNLPLITYGFDNSFIEYFGTNGIAAVDAAFDILNSLPAFSSIDTNLSEYPLSVPGLPATTFRDARRKNDTAAALRLLDLKSTTLSVVLEELGLAEPERFTWTLADRKTDAGPPPTTNYFVIQRNFDPVTWTPTAYVNGNRYTYQIAEFQAPDYADAIEIPIDPQHSYNSVAGGYRSGNMLMGVFYDYITRDDIGGLRYIYTRDNVNWETFPTNTFQFVPDLSRFQTISNMDLTLFSVHTLTSSPEVLSNLYPGLIISSAVGRLTNSTVTVPVSTQIFVSIVTNRDDLQVVAGLDLYDFSNFTLTNPPSIVTNNTTYPGLQIVNFSQTITTRQDIASIVLTNGPRYPWGDPFATNLIFVTNYVTNLGVLYHYRFANVLTNVFSPTTLVRRETSGVDREPWSDPLNPFFKTNIVDTLIARPSGNIFILSTNLLSYEFTGISATNITLITNYFNQTNFVINGFLRSVTDAEYRFQTNIQYAVYPITALTQGFFTNIVIGTTNIIVTNFNYQFANVVTNYFTPNGRVAIRTNIITPGGVTNFAGLGTATTLFGTNVFQGGFLIDTNQTGFTFTGVNATNLIPMSIFIREFTDANGNRIQEFAEYIFTNVVYGIVPVSLQPLDGAPFRRPGIDKLRFVKVPHSTLPNGAFVVSNRFNATYLTNNALITGSFVVTNNAPDILFVASFLPQPQNGVQPFLLQRSENFVNNAAINGIDPNQGGPGQINPTVVITLQNVGQGLLNQLPGFVTEESVLNSDLLFGTDVLGKTFFWGSFDGTTNAPIVYPRDITLEQIQSRILGGSSTP